MLMGGATNSVESNLTKTQAAAKAKGLTRGIYTKVQGQVSVKDLSLNGMKAPSQSNALSVSIPKRNDNQRASVW